MTMLGAGVIGLGVGEQHADGYARLSRCEVVALCDRSEEKLKSVRSKYRSATATIHWREVVADERIDIISIASSDDDHADQAVAALDAGKNVFVEKPMCRSNGELKQIKKSLARHSHLHLASNLVLRAAPVYGWLRDSIRRGDFGEIYAIDGDYLYGRLHKITDGWRKDVDNYSVMQGGGVHLVDLMLWLTGERPLDVTTQGNRICTRDTAFHQSDFMASTFSFASGMIGRITANFGCVHRHQHVLKVFGTKATFLLDDCGPRIHHSRNSDSNAEPVDLAVLPSAKWDLIPGFVGAILAGNPQMQSNQQEFDLMAACLAANKALEERRTVEIEYL
jgi:predicted dehydrogenase